MPELLPNYPTLKKPPSFQFSLATEKPGKKATLRISNMKGNILKTLPIELKEGLNEILYEHGYNIQGILNCTLLLDGKPFQSRQMIFAN